MGTALQATVRRLYGDKLLPNNSLVLCCLMAPSCETRAFAPSIWYGAVSGVTLILLALLR